MENDTDIEPIIPPGPDEDDVEGRPLVGQLVIRIIVLVPALVLLGFAVYFIWRRF